MQTGKVAQIKDKNMLQLLAISNAFSSTDCVEYSQFVVKKIYKDFLMPGNFGGREKQRSSRRLKIDKCYLDLQF